MTSLVDSEAQFNLRLEQVRVPQALRIALRNSGITTISSLAYAHGQPGQPIVADDFTAWVRQLEPNATIGAVSSLKRLLFESQTQLLAMLKEQVTNPEPTTARKVPQAEREARLANLRNRLNGVLIEGHAEPSHALLDLATQLYDQNVLRCIPLEKCYSRLTELAATSKTQTKLLEVESSKIIVKDKDAEIESNVQSSYQLLEALKRRGLALDFAGVMSYTRHDKYVQLLFSHLNREPPTGYNRCSVSQLISADKAAWTTLIERNIKPRPDHAGALAMDTELEASLKSYEVSFALLPLVSKAQPKASSVASDSHATSKSHQAYGAAKGGKKGTFRQKPYPSKGKGKGKKSDQRIPKEIREAGGTASTPDGAHSKGVVNRSRKDHDARRDTICAAFAMALIRWQTTKSIDSLAKKHRANASFPLVQIPRLPKLMPLSFTSPFCRMIKCMTIMTVPVSLFLLSNMHTQLSKIHALSRALLQRTHSSSSFALALLGSQPAFSN